MMTKLTRSFACLTLAAAMLAGCTTPIDGGVGDPLQEPDPDQEEQGPVVLPSHVTITLHGALVRPWDANQELWDDSKKVPIEDVAALAVALQAPEPYVEAATLIADGLIAHWAPPDPYGDAVLLHEGQWQQELTLSTPDDNFDNTFSPMFAGTGWSAVPFEEDLRVQLTLVDEDDFLGGADDPIGSVVLDHDQLVDAYLDGGNTPIQVSDQGSGTILFVNISVAPADPPEEDPSDAA